MNVYDEILQRGSFRCPFMHHEPEPKESPECEEMCRLMNLGVDEILGQDARLVVFQELAEQCKNGPADKQLKGKVADTFSESQAFFPASQSRFLHIAGQLHEMMSLFDEEVKLQILQFFLVTDYLAEQLVIKMQETRNLVLERLHLPFPPSIPKYAIPAEPVPQVHVQLQAPTSKAELLARLRQKQRHRM